MQGRRQHMSVIRAVSLAMQAPRAQAATGLLRQRLRHLPKPAPRARFLGSSMRGSTQACCFNKVWAETHLRQLAHTDKGAEGQATDAQHQDPQRAEAAEPSGSSAPARWVSPNGGTVPWSSAAQLPTGMPQHMSPSLLAQTRCRCSATQSLCWHQNSAQQHSLAMQGRRFGA